MAVLSHDAWTMGALAPRAQRSDTWRSRQRTGGRIAAPPTVVAPGRNVDPRSLDTAEVLELQSTAGNRAVAQLLADGHVAPQVAQRKPGDAGWTDADTSGSQGGWNVKARDVGAIRRVPIEGLTLGNQTEFKNDEERAKTSEGAAGKAIVLLPAGLDTDHPVDVLFHLHGYTHRSSDPHAGWRQDSSDATVRDVDQDRIEQQMEAARSNHMVAVMPQGIGASEFGKLPVDGYLTQVFAGLQAAGEPKPKAAGGSTASPLLSPGRLHPVRAQRRRR